MVPEKSDSVLGNYPIINLNAKLKLSFLCVHIGNKFSISSEGMYFKTAYEYKDGYY